MSVKDIIDAERRRLRTHARKGTQHHSWGEAALNRIEAAVESRIKELELQNHELLERVKQYELDVKKSFEAVKKMEQRGETRL